MLDDFIIEQPISYKIIKNSLKKKKCSHAYLIEGNGYSKSFEFAISVAKSLLCPQSYTNLKNCDNCLQCFKIDKSEFLELKIIEAETQWIKKIQLDELQDEFSKKSITGNRRVYIIKDAEKLNDSSSNSLLKFLEEPNEGIIAILLTSNKNQLLDTIVSRCQIISLKKSKEEKNINTSSKILPLLNFPLKEKKLNIEEITTKIEIVLEFVKYYEDNKLNTLLYINKVWNDYFKERNDILNAFTLMLLIYKDAFNVSLNRKIDLFTDYKEKIDYIANKNKTMFLIDKINVIINLREKIKFNANSNLLMDKLIIELEGCEQK